ncbi:MAG: peptidoglycan-binding protein [Patescibacteria group bacterium]|nr:peptidoglycan-binding protein [Patescibacteria group bacterium]
MNKLFLGIFAFVLLMVFAPSLSLAQISTSNTQAQLDLIANLTKQIQALQEQIKALQQEKQKTTVELVNALRVGSQGDQVKILQAMLAADSDIYPEGLITGYFGSLTEKAVKRFQKKHQIDQAGIVGSRTLEKLNKIFDKTPVILETIAKPKKWQTNNSFQKDDEENKNRPCAIVPPGHLIAPGWLRKQGGEKPIVPVCQELPYGIAKKLGFSTSTPTSTPDIVAPIISSIASNAATSSAIITWVTNESATSKIYYSTVTPLNIVSTSTLSVSASSLVTNHTLHLTGLNASTTYYFVIKSADAANNYAISAEQLFTTDQ